MTTGNPIPAQANRVLPEPFHSGLDRNTHQFDLGGGAVLNVPNNIRLNPRNIYHAWDKTILNRINKIDFLYNYICGNPIMLYVETAFPALLRAYVTAATPGKIDMLKSRLNHSYRCGFKKLFRQASKFLPVESEDGVRFLFRFTGTAFRVNWYYFLADVATEFALNWETAILQQQQCTPSPVGGPCQLSAGDNALFIPNTFVGFNFRSIDNDPSGWASNTPPATRITPNKVSGFFLTLSSSFFNNSGVTQTITMDVLDGFGATCLGPSSVTCEPKQTVSNVIGGRVVANSGTQASYQPRWSISQSTGTGVSASAATFACGAN